MIFLNEKHTSRLQKICILVCLSMACVLASLRKRSAVDFHQTMVIVCAFIYILRLGVTLFVFLKRRLVGLETLTIAMSMSGILFMFIESGKAHPKYALLPAVSGIVLFMGGSFINTYSEYLRYNWKKNPENTGHIYRYGLFTYSMHVNYCGDVLLFFGFSILTGAYWTVIIPIGMLFNFIIFVIPRLDEYLSQKYGDEFVDYAKNTKKLFPFIY